MFSSSLRFVFIAVDLDREPFDLAFELGPVVAGLVGLHASFADSASRTAGVGDQALGDVEAQQRLDRRAQHLAAGLVLGQRADLLGVEEEELRDLEREEVLDELAPVLGVPAVGQAIQRAPAALRAPCRPAHSRTDGPRRRALHRPTA